MAPSLSIQEVHTFLNQFYDPSFQDLEIDKFTVPERNQVGHFTPSPVSNGMRYVVYYLTVVYPGSVQRLHYFFLSRLIMTDVFDKAHPLLLDGPTEECS